MAVGYVVVCRCSLLPIEHTLILSAITHSSYAKEHPDSGSDNEILEFVGDAVLQLCVTDLLLSLFPGFSEGDPTRIRHQLVDTTTLASVARELQLGCLMRLGLGEERSGGRDRDRMLANVFEALLGALYQYFDLQTCQGVISANFTKRALSIHNVIPPKQFLMEWCQKKYQITPEYQEIDRQGPAHDPMFTVGVWINGTLTARGQGKSKKSAQVASARNALVVLGLVDANSPKTG